jgi:hypothetical protein
MGLDYVAVTLAALSIFLLFYVSLFFWYTYEDDDDCQRVVVSDKLKQAG